MTIVRYFSDDQFDAFRLAYEIERRGTKHFTELDEELQERYDRGRIFAQQCAATGYKLEPWPLDQHQPPVGASNAFAKTIGVRRGQRRIQQEVRR